MPEMWARCEPCDRWFYVAFTTGEEMARRRCPVCDCPPTKFEVRLANSAFDVHLDAGGDPAPV
ncbi:MAG TPA: hypothetical protein VM307_03565 [Egibacteraceae bacterium]|nr:hypothetical protein [Egibacteraceae bacterium]